MIEKMGVGSFLLTLFLPAALCATVAMSNKLHGAAKRGGYKVRRVEFTIEHQADGKKYPVYLKESYSLTSDGKLGYTAYFGGIPMEMNHVDSLDHWKSGDRGQSVLDMAQRLVPKLKKLSGGAVDPGPGAYIIGLEKDGVASTHFVQDRKSKAWTELDVVVQNMVADFEKATGRPLRPDQLPQRSTGPVGK